MVSTAVLPHFIPLQTIKTDKIFFHTVRLDDISQENSFNFATFGLFLYSNV